MNDWKARAEREAAALIHGMDLAVGDGFVYQRLIDVAAMAWLQGAIFATHMDLQALEEGADATRAAL